MSLDGPEMRIGAVDDPEYAFGGVSGIDLLPDGRILSFHVPEQTIRIWTPQGEPDGRLGRRGRGPGEFEGVLEFGVFGDTIWAYDRQALRTTRFGSDGRVLGTTSPSVDEASAAAGRFRPRPGRPLRDGSYIGSAPPFANAVVRGEITSSTWVRFSADGTLLNTIWRQAHQIHDVLALIRGNGSSYAPQPFGDEDLIVPFDGGLQVLERRAPVSMAEALLRVTRMTSSGDTVFRTAIPFTPVALSRSRVDSAVRAEAERSIQLNGQFFAGVTIEGLQEELRDAIYVPAWAPVADQMLMTGDGGSWIRQARPGPEGRVWWVLGAEGQPVGTVVTPIGLTVMFVQGDQVYGVETDELGVNYIVRYVIQS